MNFSEIVSNILAHFLQAKILRFLHFTASAEQDGLDSLNLGNLEIKMLADVNESNPSNRKANHVFVAYVLDFRNDRFSLIN
jgi:hypothetical protein